MKGQQKCHEAIFSPGLGSSTDDKVHQMPFSSREFGTTTGEANDIIRMRSLFNREDSLG